MRITNKIMQNNSLQNINNNKILQDKLNSQLTTQSKIVRPSDDPVIALRALRLRTNLSQLTQYSDRNVKDAQSWMTATEDALLTIADVITGMSTNCSTGANGTLDIADRQKILEALKQSRDEVYATGNADLAGRSLFTGYRTDRKLYFEQAVQKAYNITETFTKANMDKVTYVDTYKGVGTGNNILDANAANAGTNGGYVDAGNITKSEIYRLRLSYNNLDLTRNATIANTVNVTAGDPLANRVQIPEFLMVQQLGPNGKPLTDATGRFVYEDLVGANGAFNYTMANSTDDPSPYSAIDYEAGIGDDEVILLADTGEVLMGKNVYEAMLALPNDQQIIVNYDKTDWRKNDLIPEHYFECTSFDEKGTKINYNPEYLYLNAKDSPESQTAAARQSIEYNIGFNQTLSVNVLGSECFKHTVGRDVDDLIRVTEKTLEAQKVLKNITDLLKETDPSDPDYEDIKKTLAAAQKAFDYYQDYNQKMFEAGITKMQGHLDEINITVTNLGSRSKRLELIGNRLTSQKTNFTTLAEENEGIEPTEVIILLSSAQLSYEAALKATGKVLQASLVDFI